MDVGHSQHQRSHQHREGLLTFALFKFRMRKFNGSRLTTVAPGRITYLFPDEQCNNEQACYT